MKYLITTLCIIFASYTTYAQKVATYATGTPNEADYESFAFWTKENGSRDFITYNYGKDRTEAKVSYGGASNFKGIPSFKIQFNNKLVLHVMINGDQLQIADLSGKYLKTFKWEYEGPINGIGTFCNVCAADAAEALLITKKFIQ